MTYTLTDFIKDKQILFKTALGQHAVSVSMRFRACMRVCGLELAVGSPQPLCVLHDTHDLSASEVVSVVAKPPSNVRIK